MEPHTIMPITTENHATTGETPDDLGPASRSNGDEEA